MVVHVNRVCGNRETVHGHVVFSGFREEGSLELLLDLTPLIVLVRGALQREIEVDNILVESAAVDRHGFFISYREKCQSTDSSKTPKLLPYP